MTRIGIFFAWSVFCLGATTTVAQAYFTTNQMGFSVDGTTGVFVIEYVFGHEDHNLIMPLNAARNATLPRTIGFDILKSDNTPGKGSAVGIVLSPRTPQNGVYTTRKGESSPFRLLVLYTRTPEEAGEAFRLQVTSLPFAFKGVRDLKLNDSELAQYTTPLTPFTSETSVPVSVSHTK